MYRQSIVMSGVAAITLMSGCQQAAEPTVATPPAEPDPVRAESLTQAVECGPREDSGSLPGRKIRVTLNGDGTLDQIEGMDGGNNFEPFRNELEPGAPVEGYCVARIELYNMDKELPVPDHQHSGQQHTTSVAHCHKTVIYNNRSYVVHC